MENLSCIFEDYVSSYYMYKLTGSPEAKEEEIKQFNELAIKIDKITLFNTDIMYSFFLYKKFREKNYHNLLDSEYPDLFISLIRKKLKF